MAIILISRPHVYANTCVSAV